MLVNFSWLRDSEVAGMGLPGPDSWAELGAAGVRAVLSLTGRPPAGDPHAAGLTTLHVPLFDFGTPSRAQLTLCTDWIRSEVSAGRPVVVHCLAGQGRTGTVLAAWLVTTGLSAEAAIGEVRRARPHSIETRGQEDAVRDIAAHRPGADSRDEDGTER